MSILHQLPVIIAKKDKRLGRGLGSGVGAKSTRGTTRHQKARRNIPLSFEGGQNRMTKKFALLRGKGRNKSVFPKAITVRTSKLSAFNTGDVVSVSALIEKRIVGTEARKNGVKIVADKEITQSITVSVPVSKKAQELIEKAGGKLATV